VLFPVGELDKAAVRAYASTLGLRTASKPDSQDVCFITKADGRRAFLSSRIPLRPGRVLDTQGAQVGEVDAVELVTVGQRRGLGAVGGERAYALAVDVATATITVGQARDLLVGATVLTDVTFVGAPVLGPVLAQCSAHGMPRPAHFDGTVLAWQRAERKVAPGQSVALYDPTDAEVLGGGIAT
jgi:tRNA-specific 2-thiouridylase